MKKLYVKKLLVSLLIFVSIREIRGRKKKEYYE